jgi:hypothetical protein
MKEDFKTDIDQVGLIIEHFTNANHQQQLNDLIELAKHQYSFESFEQNLIPGRYSQSHLDIINTINNILSSFTSSPLSACYNLLRHFVLSKMDFLQQGSAQEPALLRDIQTVLSDEDKEKVNDLWNQLIVIAQEAKATPAVIDRALLIKLLKGQFRLSGLAYLNRHIETLANEANLSVSTIKTDIANVNLPRLSLIDSAKKKLESSNFLLLKGSAGTGKSRRFK